MWIPVPLVQCLVQAIHMLSKYNALLFGQWQLPYVASIDYLLQVTVHEHSFDMTAIATDFPQLAQYEETIYECFRRRRRR
jgi:hypothetical protein